jgi:hypothetical protein
MIKACLWRGHAAAPADHARSAQTAAATAMITAQLNRSLAAMHLTTRDAGASTTVGSRSKADGKGGDQQPVGFSACDAIQSDRYMSQVMYHACIVIKGEGCTITQLHLHVYHVCEFIQPVEDVLHLQTVGCLLMYQGQTQSSHALKVQVLSHCCCHHLQFQAAHAHKTAAAAAAAVRPS